jgi:hypothetical protein
MASEWSPWPSSGLSKEEMLPVEETDYGFVQKSSFRNVDRLDEEVINPSDPMHVHVLRVRAMRTQMAQCTCCASVPCIH